MPAACAATGAAAYGGAAAGTGVSTLASCRTGWHGAGRQYAGHAMGRRCKHSASSRRSARQASSSCRWNRPRWQHAGQASLAGQASHATSAGLGTAEQPCGSQPPRPAAYPGHPCCCAPRRSCCMGSLTASAAAAADQPAGSRCHCGAPHAAQAALGSWQAACSAAGQDTPAGGRVILGLICCFHSAAACPWRRACLAHAAPFLPARLHCGRCGPDSGRGAVPAVPWPACILLCCEAQGAARCPSSRHSRLARGQPEWQRHELQQQQQQHS